MFPKHEPIKDTLRQRSARLRWPSARRFQAQSHERFANEVRVLRYLEPRMSVCASASGSPSEELNIVTTNCGSRVEHLDDERSRELFAELEPYGVRHDDAELRNVTYRQSDGRFCLIDFEFSTILPGFEEPDNGPTTHSTGSSSVVRIDGQGQGSLQ
jgi:hypothetical protein